MKIHRYVTDVAAYTILFSLSRQQAYGQGCSNTCPPINFGQEVDSLCEGDVMDSYADVEKVYSICHPNDAPLESFAFQDFKGSGKITVVANYYTGCNAGRRESGVFAHVAQRYYEQYGDRVIFVQSVKGGGTCEQWAGIFQQDAVNLYPESNIVPKEMPLSVADTNYEIRDDLFTTPFGHPSYVVLDGDLRLKHKFIGPCCGYENYFDCQADTAKELDTELSGYIDALLQDSESGTAFPTKALVPTKTPTNRPTTAEQVDNCIVGDFSEWSDCSIKCGSGKGIQFRWRNVTAYNNFNCPGPVEKRSCTAPEDICTGDDSSSCIPEFGESFEVETIESGFFSPRDVAFHPTPGYHLGNYSEGRNFYPSSGEEAWVVNGGNHSVSIVASLGTEYQTTLSRRDRGYYHYMINGTAISFNAVSDSGRNSDRDGFNYFAVCNDNANTYLDTKEANFFMGPTLYNSDPQNRNLVNRLGEVCRKEEQCYFLHSDMLHEAPECIGIVHDPELLTAYGNVYWAFDATGNRENGQLVRFDFQQPHGPGSMDHAVAAIRRYVEVELERGPEGVHAGMVVHPSLRELFIAEPGSGKVIAVNADSGSYARTAREEYPIFSNRLPSFEYSIWECVEQRVFAEGIKTPTGMALSRDGDRIFVAERQTGSILVFEVASGSLLFEVKTDFKSIGGMAISPDSNSLFFVDDMTNTLNRIKTTNTCTNPVSSRLNPAFEADLQNAETILGEKIFLHKDYQCVVDPVVPDASFFDQVHEDSGYADNNTDVQSDMAGMDETATLLANRTDCGYSSELNFDALLLGGFYCHTCLPEQDETCDEGGICSNVQWLGYTCDNEYFLTINTASAMIEISTANGTIVDPESILLQQSVVYRFNVLEEDEICTTSFYEGSEVKVCAKKGPLIISINENFPSKVILKVEGSDIQGVELTVETVDDGKSSDTVMIAIIISCVAVFIAVAIFIFFVRKKRKDSKQSSINVNAGFEDDENNISTSDDDI